MRLRSADAGGVFRAAEVMRDGYGGSFEMTMVPAVQAGEYNGQLRVNNIRVKNTPTIAALINSLSLVGLFDELSGQGILFTSMEADFRLGSRYLTLVNSSAVGPSIGLSMDGVYDLTTSQMNMRGVLSPIYLVNAIGSVLTRKGEGLFGFSFTVKGKAADPVVSVNPLSGIAPGFYVRFFAVRPLGLRGQRHLRKKSAAKPQKNCEKSGRGGVMRARLTLCRGQAWRLGAMAHGLLRRRAVSREP